MSRSAAARATGLVAAFVIAVLTGAAVADAETRVETAHALLAAWHDQRAIIGASAAETAALAPVDRVGLVVIPGGAA